MEVPKLIEGLDRPEAYPFDVGEVEVEQTHMSVVFLAGDRAVKLKKPVDFEFVDYSTLEKRRQYCEREVELNRRLAPTVYHGVFPVLERDGEVVLGRDASEGEVVEWAVEMSRLPDERTLGALLERGEVGAEEVAAIGEKVAQFHGEAESGPEVAECTEFEAVAKNARNNFSQSRQQVGTTVHSAVFGRLEESNESALERHRELIASRAEQQVARDTHGDLRLDHVYRFPEESPHPELVIIDCIEFNDAFRYADPVADMAFLTMDLEAAGRWELAETFVDSYFGARDDEEGRELLDFYVAYRAAVRGKVEGLKTTEEEVPTRDRHRARRKSMRHWLLALGHLAEASRRPALVLMAGLPATGKSTVARRFGERAGFAVIDTDRVRKQLAGLDPGEDASAEFGAGIYTEGWSDRTYGECRRRAENILFAGGRVIVDATFCRADRRRRFADLAREMGVPVHIVECQTSREVVVERLEARTDDASDADLNVYDRLQDRWEPYDERLASRVHRVSTDGPVEESVEQVVESLRDAGLAE